MRIRLSERKFKIERAKEQAVANIATALYPIMQNRFKVLKRELRDGGNLRKQLHKAEKVGIQNEFEKVEKWEAFDNSVNAVLESELQKATVLLSEIENKTWTSRGYGAINARLEYKLEYETLAKVAETVYSWNETIEPFTSLLQKLEPVFNLEQSQALARYYVDNLHDEILEQFRSEYGEDWSSECGLSKGGAGSGNFDHSGISGHQGGSAPKGMNNTATLTDEQEKTVQEWASRSQRKEEEIIYGDKPVFSRDKDVTREETQLMVENAYNSIPVRERQKSGVKEIRVFDNPEDVYAQAEMLGIDPEIDPEKGVVRGFYDFSSNKLYTSTWDGNKESLDNFYHEFGHSILGNSEESATAWANSFGISKSEEGTMQKSITDLFTISAEYHDNITQALLNYFEGGNTQTVKGQYKRAMSNAFNDSFDTGWKDGGQSLPVDNDANDWVGARMSAELGYIDMLFVEAKQLKKDPDFNRMEWISDRADGYTRTLREVYNQGKLRAMEDQMVTFTGEDGEESCKTCQKLKGKRHNISWFVERNFVPPHGDGLDCSKGGHCMHGLVTDTGVWVTVGDGTQELQ
jgi:hypothetical protein